MISYIPDSPTHTYHQSSTLQIHPHRILLTDATFSSDLFVVVMLPNAVSCPSLCYEQETGKLIYSLSNTLEFVIKA